MWHWPDWQSKCTFPGAKQGTELELNKEVYMYLQMGKVKRCGNESMTTFTPPPPISFFSPLRGKLCCNGLFMCVRGVCLHCMAVRDRFPIFLDGSLSQLGARWRWQRCRERENTPTSVCHLGTKQVPEIKALEEQMWKRNTHNNIASFSTFVLFGQDWVITINHSICSHTHTPSLSHSDTQKVRQTHRTDHFSSAPGDGWDWGLPLLWCDVYISNKSMNPLCQHFLSLRKCVQQTVDIHARTHSGRGLLPTIRLV